MRLSGVVGGAVLWLLVFSELCHSQALSNRTNHKQNKQAPVCSSGDLVDFSIPFGCAGSDLLAVTQGSDHLNQLADPTFWQSHPSLVIITLQQPLETMPIASELGALPYLAALLMVDATTGTVPPELGNAQALQVLYLYSTETTGPLPSQLGQLTNVWYINFQLPAVTSLPAELFALPKLDTLLIEAPNAETVLSPDIGAMTELVFMSLRASLVNTSLPSQIGRLSTNLTEIRIFESGLGGSIPSELAYATSLQHLRLHKNQLTWTIPSEIGLLTNLRTLALAYNSLEGVLPSNLAQLTQLDCFDIHQNRFTGTIPLNMQLLNLSFASFGLNTFEGRIEHQQLLWVTRCDYSGLDNDRCARDCESCTFLEVSWKGCNSQGQGRLCVSVFYFLPIVPIFSVFIWLVLRVAMPERGNGEYITMTLGTVVSVFKLGADVLFCVTSHGAFQVVMILIVGIVLVWGPTLAVRKLPDLVKERENSDQNKLGWIYAFTIFLCLINVHLLPNLISNDPVEVSGFKSWLQLGSVLLELPQLVVQILYNSLEEITLSSLVATSFTSLSLVLLILRVSANRHQDQSSRNETHADQAQSSNPQQTENQPKNCCNRLIGLMAMCSVAIAVATISPKSQLKPKTLDLVARLSPNEAETFQQQPWNENTFDFNLHQTSTKQLDIAPSEVCEGNNVLAAFRFSYMCSLNRPVARMVLRESGEDLGFQDGLEQLFVLVSFVTLQERSLLTSDVGRMNQLVYWHCPAIYQGELPTQIGLLTNLVRLDLSDLNNYNGSAFPSQLGQLTLLHYFVCPHCGLLGPLPTQIFQLSDIFLLDLRNNRLYDEIRSEFGLLKNLEELALPHTWLTGTLPTQLGLLTKLKSLDVKFNELEGTLPSQMGLMSSLAHLDLFRNQLTGTIPSQFANIQFDWLSLGNNHLFTGQVGHLRFASADLSQTGFEGRVQSGSPTTLSCDHSKLDYDFCGVECKSCSLIEFEWRGCNEIGQNQQCIPGYYALPFVVLYAIAVVPALKKFVPGLKGTAFVLTLGGVVFGIADLATDIGFAFVSGGWTQIVSFVFLGLFAVTSLTLTTHAFYVVADKKDSEGEYVNKDLRERIVESDLVFAFAISFCLFNFRQLPTILKSKDNAESNEALTKKVIIIQVLLETLPQLVLQCAAIGMGQGGFVTLAALTFTCTEVLVECVRLVLGKLGKTNRNSPPATPMVATWTPEGQETELAGQAITCPEN